MTGNPGSLEAINAGCCCAVLDNNYGLGVPWPRTDGKEQADHPRFWINGDCPLHGTEEEK